MSSKIEKKQIRHSMRFAFVAAISGILGMACLDGPVLTLLAIKVGGKELFIGAVNFLVWGSAIFSLLTIAAMEKYGKKAVLVTGHGIATIFILPLLFLEWTSETYTIKVSLAVLFIATMLRSIANAMGGVGWFPILHDLIPRRVTGKFFARLRISWQIAYLLSLLTIAFFLNTVGPDSDPQWWRFKAIFFASLIVYVVRIYSLNQMSEKPLANNTQKSPSIIERFAVAMSNPKIRMFLLYLMFYMVAHSMAQPFRIKLLKDMGHSYGFILTATAFGSAGAIVSLKFWGKLADRFGNRSVFSLSHAGMIVTSLLWILVGDNMFSSILVFVLFFTSWIFNSGNGIAQTRYMLHTVPPDKQYLMCIIHLFWGLSAASGPLIAGFFLSQTGWLKWQTGAVTLNNYHVLFIISSLLFIVPHLLRKNLRADKEASTVEVLTIIARPALNLLGPLIELRTKRNNGQNK